MSQCLSVAVGPPLQAGYRPVKASLRGQAAAELDERCGLGALQPARQERWHHRERETHAGCSPSTGRQGGHARAEQGGKRRSADLDAGRGDPVNHSVQ